MKTESHNIFIFIRIGGDGKFLDRKRDGAEEKNERNRDRKYMAYVTPKWLNF